uniref:(northern house mosquito) hypothetical protein n=2 Tax=Culex pipiens TaxID=7175 RepID=A0A8D8JTC5_CULPI
MMSKRKFPEPPAPPEDPPKERNLLLRSSSLPSESSVSSSRAELLADDSAPFWSSASPTDLVSWSVARATRIAFIASLSPARSSDSSVFRFSLVVICEMVGNSSRRIPIVRLFRSLIFWSPESTSVMTSSSLSPSRGIFISSMSVFGSGSGRASGTGLARTATRALHITAVTSSRFFMTFFFLCVLFVVVVDYYYLS